MYSYPNPTVLLEGKVASEGGTLNVFPMGEEIWNSRDVDRYLRRIDPRIDYPRSSPGSLTFGVDFR